MTATTMPQGALGMMLRALKLPAIAEHRRPGRCPGRARGLDLHLLPASTIVYVGESHTGRLYETMTRHFQAWSRSKSFWFGLFSPSDNDPGTTYDREACEVAIRITRTPSAALAAQADLIRKLKPRDNVLGTVHVVPF